MFYKIKASMSLAILLSFMSISIPTFSQQIEEVDSIYVFVSKHLGKVDGYIVFRNKKGNMVTAEGEILIGRYAFRDYYNGQIFRGAYENLYAINITPTNFQKIVLRSGDAVLAVSFTIDAALVKEQDLIEAEFRPTNSRLKLTDKKELLEI